jgi:FKBP-type peptidyl-prolyl cis-trans isomerase FklB
MMTIIAALPVGTAAAQQPPIADKPRQEAQVATKQALATPPVSKEQPVATAAKSELEAAAPGNSKPGEPIIQSPKDKISYAFGVDMARDLQRQKDGLNVDLLMRALTDALAGKNLLMTDEEVAATVKTFETEQKQDLQHAKMMVFERNKREGEAFFAENAKKEGVITLPSGLQYKMLKKGDGKIPTLDDVVVCNYTGKLLDGTVVDSSNKRKEPTLVPVKGVIAGWAQALQLMPVGSKWEMYIPPQLAYGDKGSAIFGPNTTLVFEVELVSIQDKPQTVGALQGKQPAVAAVR